MTQKLSQRELSAAIGVSRGYIGDIEAGRSEPSRNFLERLQERFGLRADYILYGEDDPVAADPPKSKHTQLDEMTLMICGEAVKKVYKELGLKLPTKTHFEQAVWIYNELIARMENFYDGDEMEELLPHLRETLKTRLEGADKT
ncbi:Hypothetical protein RAK1035_2406 [Roseovarius sp. AK1035]|nr:Hypothetical protein RAK1035_2406 [Roseovarius sp. AK1035]